MNDRSNRVIPVAIASRVDDINKKVNSKYGPLKVD